MGTFVADFETTTNLEDCRVWAYALCEVGNESNTIVGTTIEDFMNWCKDSKENHKVYFHNLKFDGQFIMSYLFRNGFLHTTEQEDRATNTFNTLITNDGLYYQIEVIFLKKGKRINKVTFQDSLKLIPLSVDEIAKAFKMDICKLKIDYSSHNNLPVGSSLTFEEEQYIKHDVKIVARAIDYFYSQGLNKMTIGSCALNEYKELIFKKNFNRFFPIPKADYHNDVKQSYRGGFTYLNPKFKEKKVGKGIVLDVNSLYPSIMYDSLLPFGIPIFFKGKYEYDDIYPLYTQMIRCSFKLKKDKIPTIQIKHCYDFVSNEYLESSNDLEVVLCLNSVDLKLFFEHYDVYNLEYISGWKFKAVQGLFTEYIDKWNGNKIKAKEEENHGLYLISKLFLNSLYGKFGTDIKVRTKIPYLNKDGVIHFRDSDIKYRDGVYIAMASFITSYARLKTISSAQRITDNYNSGRCKAEFVYADTDSLHIVLNGEDENEFLKNCGLDIHPTKLGAWDNESKFICAKFLRQKCYIEKEIIDEDTYNKNINGEFDYLYSKDDKGSYKLKITVSGMPKGCYPYVNFNNFKIGASYKGKMSPKMTQGGVVLSDIDFTIKE